MSITEFASLVKDMRDAQWKYFKTKAYSWLNEAKSLEKQVDKAVNDILHPQPTTGKLF